MLPLFHSVRSPSFIAVWAILCRGVHTTALPSLVLGALFQSDTRCWFNRDHPDLDKGSAEYVNLDRPRVIAVTAASLL